VFSGLTTDETVTDAIGPSRFTPLGLERFGFPKSRIEAFVTSCYLNIIQPADFREESILPLNKAAA
jgi:hypothetical protein